MRWSGKGPNAPEGVNPTLAILGALCLFLSALEYLIPKPLPFLRIGLANAPLLLALDILSPGAFVLLGLIKVVGQGLLSGTLFSYVFLFSLTGTALSAALMYSLRRLLGRERTGLLGISVLGALISNASQITLARFFVFGKEALILLPPFLALGIFTGGILGLFCERFTARSRWYGGLINEGQVPHSVQAETSPPGSPEPPRISNKISTERGQSFREKRRMVWGRLFKGNELCFAGLIMGLIFLLTPSTLSRAFLFLFFWLLAWLSGKRNNPLFTLGVIATAALFNLAVPYGQVLAEWGPLRITAGSLEGGLRRGVTLEGLIMLSAATIREDLHLPGPLGSLLGESFRFLERLREKQRSPKWRDLDAWLDKLLLELSVEGAASGAAPMITPDPPYRPWPARFLLAAIVFVTTVIGFVPVSIAC